MKQSQFGQILPQSMIPLPPRTRALLEKKAAEIGKLKALLHAEEQSITDLIAAAREMLGVPDGWIIQNTEQGFVAPAGAVAPTVEVVEVPAGDMAEPESIEA